MRAVIILLSMAYLSSEIIAQDRQPEGGKRIVCYFTYWSTSRRPPYNFKPEDLDPFLCTHVIYAFAIFGKNYDFDKTQGNFTELQPRLLALKQRNPELKIMFAAGGWREGSTGFAEITKNQESRMNFSQNVVTFLRESDFDGIDLNWQHPTFREGGKPEDKENYVLLAQTLREQFEKEAMETGSPRLLLAISITQSMKALPAYDIRSFNVYMDFISVLCYDYVFSYTSTVKHHAPLYAIPGSPDYEDDKTLNIDYTINYFLEQADAQKLVLGIPTYGRTKRLVDPGDTELGAEADGPGTKGPYTNEPGFLAYFEICSIIKKENWTVARTKPYGSVGPHAFKGNQWVGYDDVEMVRTKTRYAKQRGLAGVVFWTIDYDDFLGTCGEGRYPLINAAKDELNMKSYRNETQMMPSTEPIRTTMQPRRLQTDNLPRPSPAIPSYYTPRIRPPDDDRSLSSTTDQRMDAFRYEQPEENDLQNNLVEELIQLIERAGGMKNFCRILREARTSFKRNRGSVRRYDDMIVELPNLEPLRLLISNSSITIQELNLYGGP